MKSFTRIMYLLRWFNESGAWEVVYLRLSDCYILQKRGTFNNDGNGEFII